MRLVYNDERFGAYAVARALGSHASAWEPEAE
jgi:hypothetical protein